MHPSLNVIFILVILFLNVSVSHAQLTVLASGAAARSNLSTQVQASFQGEVQDSPLGYFVSADASSYRSKATFVETVGESEIKGAEGGAELGFSLFNNFDLGFYSSQGNINSGAVAISEYSISPGFRFDKFRISASMNVKSYVQQKPYTILTRDVKDELRFKKTSYTGRLSYNFSDSISIGFSHTTMNYDKDMETAFVLLTTPTLAQNNGVEMLSQLNGILQSVSEVSFTYGITDRAELEASVGRAKDFYDPKSISTDYRLGVLLFQTEAFNWGVGVTSARSEVDGTATRSFDGLLSYTF